MDRLHNTGWKFTDLIYFVVFADNYGIPQKRLHGHGHFVSDVVLSSDGHFALSGKDTTIDISLEILSASLLEVKHSTQNKMINLHMFIK